MDFLVCFFLITTVIEPSVSNQSDIDATRNGSSGIITSPSYPESYPNNANYTWILNTGNLKSEVVFDFYYFNITKYQYTPHCEDFLVIKETEPCCFEAMKRCGYFKPFNLTVEGYNINISFVSDNLHNAKGFNFTWKVYMYMPNTSTSSTTLKEQSSKTSLRLPATYLSMARTKVPVLTTTFEREISITTINTIRKTQTLASTKDVSLQTSTMSSVSPPPILEPNEITVGIGVVELTLIAFGIYIVKKRRTKSRSPAHEMLNKDRIESGSRKSAVSVGNAYESIPMEHFSSEEEMLEENKALYIDVPQNVYDKAFQHRPHVNANLNMYQLMSELKKKTK